MRVAKSPADGYTLSLGTTQTFAVSPNINTTLPYDPIKDFDPIAILGQSFSALVVNASMPVNTVGELVALAKANPGKLNFASQGNGSTHHLNGEMFRRAAGIDVVHVPYKGSAQALLALVSGEVQFYIFPVFVGSSAQLASGRLRALGLLTAKRSPLAPEVPTMSELGYDIVTPTWHILVAPASTPKAVVQRLAGGVERQGHGGPVPVQHEAQGRARAVDRRPSLALRAQPIEHRVLGALGGVVGVVPGAVDQVGLDGEGALLVEPLLEGHGRERVHQLRPRADTPPTPPPPPPPLTPPPPTPPNPSSCPPPSPSPPSPCS